MTVHRDALAAAQARIAALESALDEARGGSRSDDALRDEIGRLELMLSAARADLRVAEERAEKAEAALAREQGRARAEQARAERDAKKRERDGGAGAAPRDASELRMLLTLDQHNRSLPAVTPTKSWRRSGVLCPSCAESGERVELGLVGMSQSHGPITLEHVMCARCGFTGVKRDR